MKGNERKAENKMQKNVGAILRTCSQKGITLIALIITIIVMLILVGVTINVALNGGLFTTAQTATKETQIEADREQLLSAVVASYEIETGTISKSKLELNLGNGWKVEGEEGGPYTVTSPKGNVFTVDVNGNIDYKGKYTAGEETSVAFDWETVGLAVDTNTEYIYNDVVLIFSTDGKLSISDDGISITTVVDATDSKYINNGIIDFTEEIMGEKTRVKVEMNSNNTDIDLTLIYFEEDGITEKEPQVGTCVKVVVDSENIYTNEEVMQALGETGGEYKGTWTVIERDESGNPTKLVSTTAVTYCELGEYGNLEKCISDYKNAETILNTKAKEATGIESARSIKIEDIYDIIGEENVDKGLSYGKKYNYYYENGYIYSKYQTDTDESGEIIWSEPYNTNYSSETFVDDNGNTVVVDSEGDNVALTNTYYDYNLTEEQKIQLGTLASGNYWLASPCVDCSYLDTDFWVRCICSGEIVQGHLFRSDSYADHDGGGIRAVVSVPGL